MNNNLVKLKKLIEENQQPPRNRKYERSKRYAWDGRKMPIKNQLSNE